MAATPSTTSANRRRSYKRLPRISGARLQRIRERFLYEHPLCVHCEAKGLTVLAAEVDHRIPLHKGGADEDSNRQGLCKACHKAKTREDLGQKPRVEIGVDGFPVE